MQAVDSVWVVKSIPIIDLNVDLHILMFNRHILNYVTVSVTC